MSSSDLEAPSALGRVKPLDTSVVTSALADDSDDELPTPGALAAAASKKASAIESLLREEKARERAAREADDEPGQQFIARTFWRNRPMGSMSTLDCEEYGGEGWRGQVAQALRGEPSPPFVLPDETHPSCSNCRLLHITFAVHVSDLALLAAQHGRDRFSGRPPSHRTLAGRNS